MLCSTIYDAAKHGAPAGAMRRGRQTTNPEGGTPMNIDMTQGPTMKSMLRFALPMIGGNLLQQCYNIADTLIVGRFLGPNALAAVGSSFTLMTFLTSILLGLCMGSGTFFSMRYGEGNEKGLKEGICASFALIFSLTILLNLLVFLFLGKIKAFLKVPDEVWPDMRGYLAVIFLRDFCHLPI